MVKNRLIIEGSKFRAKRAILRISSLYGFVAHCVKSVRILSYSGLHFPSFGQNTERYGVSHRIQSECGKIRTRITPNTDTFHAVNNSFISLKKLRKLFSQNKSLFWKILPKHAIIEQLHVNFLWEISHSFDELVTTIVFRFLVQPISG